MTIVLVILCVLILIALIYLIYLHQKPSGDGDALKQQQALMDFSSRLSQEIGAVRKEISESTGKSREEIQNRLDHMNKELLGFQKSTTVTLQSQFDTSQKIIKDITQKLTEIGGTNDQVLGFAKQMKSLENILKNPKQRGVLGEYFLETLLGNVLAPNQYQMQYRFESGEIVDAVVFFNNKVIPIDSKFSLEKYNMMVETDDPVQREVYEKEFKGDIKRRIDETSKYIRPSEGTTDFAFMFVPAEGIYYNMLIYNVGTLQLNTQDLIEYAFKKHVIIVSPTSFYAYLETVLQGMKALKIEESVKEIIKRVGILGKHLVTFEEFMSRLGKNLGMTVSSYNKASKEFKKVDKDVIKITEGEEGGTYETLEIDKPQTDQS
ncbi:MAG: DNA recombination protein RmuC [Vicingaceae bacterium]